MILDAEVEPSKSIDPASEGSAILGSKAKKTGRKKLKLKSVLALPVSSTETHPIPKSLKNTDINKEELDASYEKMAEKNTKILDEKKKRYPENNSPIL